MSLGVAICICALLGAARLRRVERVALCGVALAYFVFLYSDERKLTLRGRMRNAVAAVPAGPARGHADRRSAYADQRPDWHMSTASAWAAAYSYAIMKPAPAVPRARAGAQSRGGRDTPNLVSASQEPMW